MDVEIFILKNMNFYIITVCELIENINIIITYYENFLTFFIFKYQLKFLNNFAFKLLKIHLFSTNS